MQRIERDEHLRPVGHGAHGRVEATEQHEAHHTKPHHKHRLLHRVAVVGHREPYPAHHQCQQRREHVEPEDVAPARDAVDGPREQEAERDHEQGDGPVGDEFGQDKTPLAHGRDVDLLDGARLLLAHDVERGQKSAHHHEHHRHERGYHEHLVVEVLVVEAEFAHPLSGIRCSRTRLWRDHLCEIGRAHRPLGGVGRIGCKEYLRPAAPLHVAPVVGRNAHHHIGCAALNVGQGLGIGGPPGVEHEVAVGLDAVYETAAQRGAVVVYHAHAHVSHLHGHDPRHHAHHHHGKQDDQPRQKPVAP